MQRQRLMLIGGLILAFVVVILIQVYLNQQLQVYKEEAERRAARKQENLVSVLAAKEDIPRGVVINPEMIEVKSIPREYLVPQAASSLDRIAGMITIAPIAKGEQISLTKLTYSRQSGGLAEVTPVGKRAITINVDNISSLAGMIRPGDYVDVIATLPVPIMTPDGKQMTQVASVPLFQNVLVLAVGQHTGGGGGEKDRRYAQEKEGTVESSEVKLITLALTPHEANIVTFIQEQQGRFRLVMRSPADAQMEPFKPVTWETLFQYLMPKEIAQVKPQEKVEPVVTYVEIYRGLKKDKIPLSKEEQK